jgi:hypothetical protein
MKTYVLDIIPKIKKYSKRLDDLTNLSNRNWVMYDEYSGSKRVYIFRKNNELLVSTDGEVEKGNWEYINNECILIDIFAKSFLLRLEFLNDILLLLKNDNKKNEAGYAIFVNESDSNTEFNSLESIQEYLCNEYGVNEEGVEKDLIGDDWKVDEKDWNPDANKVDTSAYERNQSGLFFIIIFTIILIMIVFGTIILGL